MTNTFGERFWIEAAGRGADMNWQRWSMFTIHVVNQPTAPADTSLLLLPTVPKTQQGSPTDEVLLIRDEAANMVWGIETIIPLASGETKRGTEAAREMLEFYRNQVATRQGGSATTETTPSNAPLRYKIMSTVPENWIPFVPVHVPDSNREIQLQRGALPRILNGEPPVKVQPRTVILREGLDRSPAQPYFLHEDEVLRAGVRVTQSFQRTRWQDGRIWLWFGVRKQTGRGEGSSGLSFDYLELHQ